MASATSSAHCDACGAGTQANHLILWLDGASDALSLRIPMHRIPFYGFLMRVADALVNGLGRLSLYGGRALRIVTLSDDTEKVASDRTRYLWEEAERRSIPMRQLLFLKRPTDTFLVRYRGRTHLFSSIPLHVEPKALRMDDKVQFKKEMRAAGLPVPNSYSASSLAEAKRALAELGTACVKPRTGSNGRHTYPHVRTEEELEAAFKSVKQICPSASVEEHLEGNLCRATCVNGTLIGFLESSHPHVAGDGISSIRELIAQANGRKLEGTHDLEVDDSVKGYIRRRGYDLDSVLPESERLQLTYRGGRYAASTNREHGRSIHSSFIPVIEAAARLTGLPVVGFDIIIPDPMQPQSEQHWGFIEANSCRG